MAIANTRMLDLMANLATKPLNMSCIQYKYDKPKCEKQLLNRAHVHDYVQIWYCKKGEYLHSIAGESLIYGEGSLIIIPAGTVHTFMTFSGVETELYELIFFPTSFDPLPKIQALTAQFFCFLSSLPEHGSRVFYFEGDEKKELEEFILKLSELTAAKLPSGISEANHIVSDLWALPAFTISEDDLRKTEKFIAERFIPFHRALRFVNKNFAQNIRQSDVINACLLPRNVFQTLFRAYTGTNLATYMTKLRIQRASYFVGYSQYSFDYIADISGFCNAQYMIARFKEHYGYTPYKPRMKYKRNIASLPEKKIGKSLAEKVLYEKERVKTDRSEM